MREWLVADLSVIGVHFQPCIMTSTTIIITKAANQANDQL